MTEHPSAIETSSEQAEHHDTAERPLVSLVILSYNQEKFIREAIEGAFAQTYSPLEIVLSDDCSPDGTFAIIEEMTAAYRGPHRIRAIQTPRNLGLLEHVLLRGRDAQGEIVVMGGGDDISKPERVAALVEAFAPDVGAVYSLNDLVDEDGNVMRLAIEGGGRPDWFNARIERAMSLVDKKRDARVTQGSTAAYRSELFSVPVSKGPKAYSEEMLLCFYCYILDLKVALVPESLVLYREHAGALSNIPDSDRIAEASQSEEAIRKKRRVEMEMFFDFHEIARHHDKRGMIDRAALLRNLREEETKFFWVDMSLSQKIASLVSSVIEFNFMLSGWCLARLLGIFDIIRPKKKLRD